MSEPTKTDGPEGLDNDEGTITPKESDDGLILVVDDDEMGRKAIERALKLSPWRDMQIGTCASALEAIRRIGTGLPGKKSSSSPDLILSEMVMRKETGLYLYEWLMRRRKELVERMGFVSGKEGTNREMRDLMFRMRGEGRLIQKPFSPEDIVQLAQTIFGNRRIG